MSASSSPFDPLDTAPIGYTRARPASAAFDRISVVTLALSLTGAVLGMQATAVNPPATADAVPVATVSLCSWPGSRRCTCMSIRPGHTTRPAGISTTVAPSAGMSRPTRAIRSSSINRSYMPSIPFEGSITRPPLSSFFMVHTAGEQIQHGHPHGDAVGHLVEDHGIRSVSHFRRDFDPAVHRARMHDHHVRTRQAETVRSHPEDVEVLALRREVGPFHPLELDTEEHDDVGIGNGFVHVGGRGNAEIAHAGRNQRR